MRKTRFACTLLLVLLSVVPIVPARADELKNVLLLRPDTDHPFWDLLEPTMRAACNDLGCTVETRKAGWDQFKMLEQLEERLKEEPKLDMVYFQSFKKNGPDIIKMLEKYETRGFLINAGLDDEQKKEIGKPREKYKYWIGEMLPDDVGAGYNNARVLYENANKKGLAVDGKVYFVGIEGNISDGASIMRKKGLNKFVAEHPDDVVLLQVVAGKWDSELSRKLALNLMERHPQAHVIWGEGDPIAKGIIEAIKEAGKVPGKDKLTSGVDWADYALQYIKSGELDVSSGGHYMEGGWAIVVTYDYLKGKDFAKNGNPSLASSMGQITPENLDPYLQKFGDGDFEKIDFRKLSKHENPDLKEYDFDMTSLLK